MATPQILSVARAFQILATFDGVRGRLTPKELAERVGMNYKTAHRFLLTLEQIGAVIRIGRGEFTLGVLLADLGNRVSMNRNVWNASMPELELLSREFRECAQVAILNHGVALSVAHVPADRTPSIGMRIGQQLTLHCSAVGKVLAAGMDDDRLQRIAKFVRMEPKTVNTITAGHAFLKEVALVRAQRFALNEQESMPGACAVAVPIFNRAGQILAAISMSGPANRMTASTLMGAQAALTQSASRISAAIYEKAKKGAPRAYIRQSSRAPLRRSPGTTAETVGFPEARA